MKFASLPQLSDAHYRRPLLRTPFYEASRPWIQTDSFIAWTGYSTPGVYSITEHEYFAIRNSCALFDLTPMVKYRISGPDAERYLNRVVTGDMRKLAVDKVVYTLGVTMRAMLSTTAPCSAWGHKSSACAARSASSNGYKTALLVLMCKLPKSLPTLQHWPCKGLQHLRFCAP